jgi:hypothetical protein
MGQAPLLKPDPDVQWKPLSCAVGHSPGVQVGADTLSSGGSRIFYMQMMSMYGEIWIVGGFVYTLMMASWGNFELMEQCLHADSDEVRNSELNEHCIHADGDHAGKLWIDGALMVNNWGTLNYWDIVYTLMRTMQENFELIGHYLHTDGYKEGKLELMEHCLHTDGVQVGNFQYSYLSINIQCNMKYQQIRTSNKMCTLTYNPIQFQNTLFRSSSEHPQGPYIRKVHTKHGWIIKHIKILLPKFVDTIRVRSSST